MLYKTIDGDVVDAICHRVYGNRPGMTEQVLEANRDINGSSLADWGPVLPAGLIISLPELADAPKKRKQLWE